LSITHGVFADNVLYYLVNVQTGRIVNIPIGRIAKGNGRDGKNSVCTDR